MPTPSSAELPHQKFATPEEIVRGVPRLASRFPDGFPVDSQIFSSQVQDICEFIAHLVVFSNDFGSVGDQTLFARIAAALRMIEDTFQTEFKNKIAVVPNQSNYLRMVKDLDLEVHPVNVDMSTLISDITPDPNDKKANMLTSLGILKKHSEMHKFAELLLTEIMSAADEQDVKLLFIGNTTSQIIAEPILELLASNVDIMTLITDIAGWAGIEGFPTAIKGQTEKLPAALKKTLAVLVRVLLVGVMGNAFNGVSRKVAREKLGLTIESKLDVLNTFRILRLISDTPQVLQTLRPIRGKKVLSIPPEMVGLGGELSEKEDEFLKRPNTKTIVFSLGSMGKQSNAHVIEAAIREVAAAVKGRGVQLFVIATSITLDLSDAENIYFTKGTNLPALMDRSEIFAAFHHGGQGSTATVTIAGHDIPQGIIPQAADQYENASFAAEGAGFFVLEMKNLDPAHTQTIVNAIDKMEQMAVDPQIKERARKHREGLVKRIEECRAEYHMAQIILNIILDKMQAAS